MKSLLFSGLMLIGMITFSQTITYLKVVDKVEYANYLAYCSTPAPRIFYMRGEVTVMKINGYYKQPVTGNWTAKWPLVIKWYPIGTTVTTTLDYQKEIVAKVEIMVPLRSPTSIDDFYKHWKNGDIQSGYIDSKSCVSWP
jgi:hypothetical protein